MPPGGFRDYVESVRAGVDIFQVVGEAVALRKAGRSMIGLCPFHHEKSPSFNVDQAKGVYYCFGCGAGGDAIKFVMNFHNVDFGEAVTMLGDRIGIARPAPSTPHEQVEDRRRRRALEALALAQDWFVQRLAAPEGAPGRDYLARRGMDLAVARRFGLGFAPSGWDGLLRFMAGRNFGPEDLVHAGLVVPRSGGDGVYDRFRNRVTFPIRDTAGRVVSFGGRIIVNEDPKYLNGPETTVYDKGRMLFRLHEATHEIRDSRRVIVVEGYFDAVSLAAAGVPGAVAVCGTAFGAAHARLVRRYADQVVLLFDGDAAGRKAVHRALGPILAEGLAVRIAVPAGGKDPDDLAREGGAAAVAACIEAAEDLPHFLVSESRRNFDLASLEGRVKALEMVLGHLVQLESSLARAEAIGRVAEGLGIEDAVIKDELRRAARERQRTVALRPSAQRPAGPRVSPCESEIIRYLVGRGATEPAEADGFLAEVDVDALGPVAREAVTRWAAARVSGGAPNIHQLAELVSGDTGTDILSLAFARGPEPDFAAARGALTALKEAHLKARMRAVQEQIQHASNPDDYERLTRQKLELARAIETLAQHDLAGSASRRPPAGGPS